MGEYVIKLPDVGEGVAEAELVEWLVEDGQAVREDDVLAAVMTDKATVEIPAPVDGTVIWRGGTIGDTLTVGAPLIRLEVAGDGNVDAEEVTEDGATKDVTASASSSPQVNGAIPTPTPAPVETLLAAPAVRKRAKDSGIDLTKLSGTGPDGRITHADLDTALRGTQPAVHLPMAPLATGNPTVTEVPVIGLRRKIAEKMALSKSRIPHITYVEEIDMTALETLRLQLNEARKDGQPKLTLLPFLVRAMVLAIGEQPHLNALFDDGAGIVHQHEIINVGVATQTDSGLVVPVIRNAAGHGLWSCAEELARLAEAAPHGRSYTRGTVRFHDHHHLPRQTRRHRYHTGDQPS